MKTRHRHPKNNRRHILFQRPLVSVAMAFSVAGLEQKAYEICRDPRQTQRQVEALKADQAKRHTGALNLIGATA